MNMSYRPNFAVLTGITLIVVCANALQAAQIDIPGPPGSVSFGDQVHVLPNGNIVVVDLGGPVANVGAVHLYDPQGTLISTLTGGTTDDRVGFRIEVLPSGNFLVRSPDWDNTAAGAIDAGAVTWVNGSTGLSGVVSPANSLVGTGFDERVGSNIAILSNGNYLVATPEWDNGAVINVGAVTWGSGSSGVSGPISAANSLIGSTSDDQTGDSVAALSNGHYVVCSPGWNNGALANAGAATWANGTSGIVGLVTASNSLVGPKAGDQVCDQPPVALSNGHYVVRSSVWDNNTANNAGAATWGNGQTGTTGTVTTGNSFVGRGDNERTGQFLTALSNGNYVVSSPNWMNGPTMNAGAVTLLAGDGPVSTFASTAISLVGTSTDDRIGANPDQIVALSNGNYVVISRFWDNGASANVGAVTWGSGSSGVSGPVSAANSLVGTSADDQVGESGVVALSNGHYVAASRSWDNGAIVDAGAFTWGNGNSGTAGPLSSANSMVGSTAQDQVGIFGVIALTNGNYVVRSPQWDNGAIANAGAATWRNGTLPTSGTVSAANSIVGSSGASW